MICRYQFCIQIFSLHHRCEDFLSWKKKLNCDFYKIFAAHLSYFSVQVATCSSKSLTLDVHLKYSVSRATNCSSLSARCCRKWSTSLCNCTSPALHSYQLCAKKLKKTITPTTYPFTRISGKQKKKSDVHNFYCL